ncbi:MAG: DNA alkylation repair protein [Planctomycetes bacterium]|nr:DNA alkylation repair protein [Planctomycetota bacterium]
MDIAEFLNPVEQQRIATALKSVHPKFDDDGYLAEMLPGIMDIPLKERMRKSTLTLNKTLALPYRKAVEVLKAALPEFKGGMNGMIPPDYIEVYGQNDINFSLKALRDTTSFGSAEFAVRTFLKLDLGQTYAAMLKWTGDQCEHVRRLASEGLRPRLPWSFQLKNLMKNPQPCFELLSSLMADESKYVRTSVANHLNDISKDNPDALLEFVEAADQTNGDTVWIIKKALRSLIKAGDIRTLNYLGFTTPPKIEFANFTLAPSTIGLGEKLEFGFSLESQSNKDQKLAIDYVIHYMKKNGTPSEKVFKLKEVVLKVGQNLEVKKSQTMAHFSTRKLYAGKHRVEIVINGQRFAGAEFTLKL